MSAIRFELCDLPALSFDLSGISALRFDLGGMPVSIVSGTPYEGDYVVIPKADAATVLPTKDKTMQDDVTVQKIPYYETANPTGDTVYIASEV